MISLDSRLSLAPQVRFRRFENEGIVLDQKRGEALVVSEVATRILELSDGTRTLQEVASILGREYDADAPALEQDVVRFATELIEDGLARAGAA
jgi:hypothetical protein